MSALWPTIFVVAAISIAIKAAGPALLGDRELPAWTTGVIAALAPALLTGLVLTDLVGPGWSDLDWRLCAGVGAVGTAYLLRAPVLAAIAVGVVVTTVLRALT